MSLQQRDRTGPRPPDPVLRRTGRKLAAPGAWFTVIGLIPLAAGLLLFFLANGWPWVLGIVLLALSAPILGVGFSLLMGSGVAGWAARRWPFA
jgi:fatty acid desaturase